jgi:hypothetical protein
MRRREERSEPRFLVGDAAVLREIQPLSRERLKVKVVDVSKNGLGIVTRKSIVPGTIVQVRLGPTIQLGEVRYCEPRRDEGFRIGLLLHIVF